VRAGSERRGAQQPVPLPAGGPAPLEEGRLRLARTALHRGRQDQPALGAPRLRSAAHAHSVLAWRGSSWGGTLERLGETARGPRRLRRVPAVSGSTRISPLPEVEAARAALLRLL
jgi:hypothetical protein